MCGWIIGAPEIPGAPDEKTVCVLTTFDPQVALRASKAYPATPRVTLGVDAGVHTSDWIRSSSSWGSHASVTSSDEMLVRLVIP